MLIDDWIAKIGLDKKRSALAKLPISVRLHNHSLWMTIQRYTAIPLLARDQLDTVIDLPLRDRASYNLINDENGGSLDMATIEEIRNHLNSKLYAAVIIYPGHKSISLL